MGCLLKVTSIARDEVYRSRYNLLEILVAERLYAVKRLFLMIHRDLGSDTSQNIQPKLLQTDMHYLENETILNDLAPIVTVDPV